MLRRSKKLSLGMKASDILEVGIFNHDAIDNNSMDGCEDDVEETDKQEKKKYLFLKDDKPDTDEQVLKFSKKLFQDAAVVGKSVSCDPSTNLASVVSSTKESGGGGTIDYPCSFVDLQSFIPLEQLGADVRVNDIWGWTHNETGIEYAIIGLDSGTAFVQLQDPVNPIIIGILPTNTTNSKWRDIKVYNNHAFIVSEAIDHGLQVFDLMLLTTTHNNTERNESDELFVFNQTAHLDTFGDSHNIAINEESGYAYAVGSDFCDGGLIIIDISDPVNPSYVNCVSAYGYVHDVQCVTYDGPSDDYVGREVCFCSNKAFGLFILDLTDKQNPELISRFFINREMKIHQGWLTEDSKYFLIDDEKNEGFCTDRWSFAPKFFAELFCKTTTIVADVSDLKKPFLAGIYRGSSSSSDHNLFIKGNEVYETNYREGLRILDVSQIDSYDEEPQVQIGSVLGDVFSWMMSSVSISGEKRQIMEEIAFFDIYPPDDCSERGAGSWSNYPYFDSGIVVVSAITQGLYVLKPDLEAAYKARKEREGEKL